MPLSTPVCILLTLPLCAAACVCVCVYAIIVMFRSLYGTEVRLERQFILPVIPKLSLPFICKEEKSQMVIWFKKDLNYVTCTRFSLS